MGDDEHLDLKFRYAWDWFSYHAGQRLTAFNFFLILMGALVVGYTQAVNNEQPAFGACLGFLGAFVAVAFWSMEVRNEELVCCGRKALDALEKQVGLSIREEDGLRVHLGDAMKGPIERPLHRLLPDSAFAHRTWLRRVIAVLGIASALGGAWAAADFPGRSQADRARTIFCQESKTSPCSALRSSSYGTATRR